MDKVKPSRYLTSAPMLKNKNMQISFRVYDNFVAKTERKRQQMVNKTIIASRKIYFKCKHPA